MEPANFLIIAGAAKSGTSSLANWLRGTPGFARFARKEPGYFVEPDWLDVTGRRPARRPTPDLASYLGSFELAHPDDWCIDASVDYLWAPGAAERIASFARERRVRVVCILRDPVERAFSEYCHTVRDGFERAGFRRALELEAERTAARFHPLFRHLRRSRYHADIERFRARFGEDVMVMGFDELSDPVGAVARVRAFLGLAPDVSDEAALRVHNPSRVSGAAITAVVGRRSALHRTAKRILPRSVRRFMREGTDRLLARRLTMTEADREDCYTRLEDDIARCLADPALPTAGWATARRLAGEPA